MSITEAQFEKWLRRYGEAWENKDASAFAALFADKAVYYRTPFVNPQKGRENIKKAFESVVEGQNDIHYGVRVLYVQAQLGAAHWSCAITRARSNTRLHVDGVCVVQFDKDGKALSFRQWWHTDERS
jgi:ketosteroid isomerase-like protein